ncbi:MAG TPA: hypothetical protein VFG76_10345 [Candidatus Polarisedimenticolia bacterium]|nr:hypothetical protein [Candidatus Polarisedimenticolia bacterium]
MRRDRDSARLMWLRALLAVSVLVLATGDAIMAAAPLTNEDIVRLTARRASTQEIIDAIRSAESTSFDLDPEVVTELRIAGVAEPVIEAMRAATNAPEPAVESPSAPAGYLEIVFERDQSGDVARNTAVLVDSDAEGHPITLSFFLLCINPLHVPDHWNSQTPLSEGFPRHHLIWHHEGTATYNKGRHGGQVYLDLPEKHRVELSEGNHTLVAGVAARAGDGPWKHLASAESSAEVLAGRDTTLVLKIKTRPGQYRGVMPDGRPAITCKITAVRPPTPPAAEQTPEQRAP